MDWVLLIGQVPFVAAIIWFAIVKDRQTAKMISAFLTALDRRDHAYNQRNVAVVRAINEAGKATCSRLDRLEDRVSTIQHDGEIAAHDASIAEHNHHVVRAAHG